MIRFQQDARKATFTAQTTTTVDEISCMYNQDPRQRGGGGQGGHCHNNNNYNDNNKGSKTTLFEKRDMSVLKFPVMNIAKQATAEK